MQIQNLIPISDSSVNDHLIKTINARDLHRFLENKQKFTRWISEKIIKYNFEENVDFVIYELRPGKILTVNPELQQKSHAIESMTCDDESGTKDFGQQGKIEYFVSLDMAKELAMVERNTKGKEARQYFIQCEKELYSKKDVTLEEMGTIKWLTAYQETLKLQQELVALAIIKEEKILKLNNTIKDKNEILEKYKLEFDEGLMFVSEFSNQIGIGVVKFSDILKYLNIVSDSTKTVEDKYTKYFNYTLTHVNNLMVSVLKVNSDGLVLLDDLVINGLFKIINPNTNNVFDGNSINKLKRTEIYVLISSNQKLFDNILSNY
jgi:phage anti-repressor protein